jgi:hypothetical protein
MHSPQILWKCSQASSVTLKELEVDFVVTQIEHSCFAGRAFLLGFGDLFAAFDSALGFTTAPDLTRVTGLRGAAGLRLVLRTGVVGPAVSSSRTGFPREPTGPGLVVSE